MFCIKCGKPAVKDNFCAEHFLEAQSLFDVKDFDMVYCDLCGLREKGIEEKIGSSIRTKYRITGKKILMKTVGNRVYATVTAKSKIKGLMKEETKKLLVMLRKKMCDMHVKLSGGYHEAVIQVRGDGKEKILKSALRLLPENSINSIETLPEGYNIKIMRKANAAAAAKALRSKFNVKESYKLVGSKKGRMLYRNFYAVR